MYFLQIDSNMYYCYSKETMKNLNNSSKTQVIENYDTVPAPILRRFGALIIDLILLFILNFLFGFAARPILEKTTNYTELETQLVREQKKSHLTKLNGVLEEDYSNIDEIDFDYDDNKQYYVGAEDYAQATYLFYTDYMAKRYQGTDGKYSNDWYITNVLLINTDKSLVEFIPDMTPVSMVIKNASTNTSTSENEIIYDDFLPEGLRFKSSTKAEDIQAFNINIYYDAIRTFNTIDVVSSLNVLLTIESAMLFVVSGSLVYLVLPLFLKDGKTLGKLLLGLGVTDKLGYKVGWASIMIRFVAFLVLYLLPLAINPLITFVITLVSLTVTTFTKKMRSLHDFISSTKLVDLKKSKIYLNPEEYRLAHIQEFMDKEAAE